MKKLINDVERVVPDSLRGLEMAHPGLVRVDADHMLVLRRQAARPGKVGVISGGGSGHDPLHAGYVGTGMLDAACVGEVFTSPVPDQVLAAIRAVDTGAGVVQVVKNYTGDILNFEMAAEQARTELGTRVAAVLVDDDLATTSCPNPGRRGTAGTLFVERLVGAAAEAGRDLDACVEVGRRVAAGCRTMGVALGSCTVPAAGRPTLELPDDQMEIGVGIHGEPGRRRVPLAPAREVAAMLVEPLLDDLRPGSDPVICLVNGMGATPLMELYILWSDVADLLRARGVRVARHLVGNHVTCLDMPGASVTLLRADDDMLRLWDAPVNTPGLRWGA